jgi:hypothetical protein
MEYLMKFKNEDEYQSYLNRGEVTPHIALIMNGYSLKYKEYTPKRNVNVGDVAYVNAYETEVNFASLDEFNKMNHSRSAIGVVVIPNNFLSDGKARIISMENMVYDNDERIIWDETGGYKTDTPVPNHNVLPLTENKGVNSEGLWGVMGLLPSDRTDSDEWLNGVLSYVDPLTKYDSVMSERLEMIPSPYLSDGSFNPQYSAYVEAGNALSDFNGLSNTQLLVNAGTQYHAAHACWNYKDAANSNLQWYLPAIGELGFLMPRFEKINNVLRDLSTKGIPSIPISVLDGNLQVFHSSSEACYDNGYTNGGLIINTGHVNLTGEKDGSAYVRAFACV